jgi:hypothetical protein
MPVIEVLERLRDAQNAHDLDAFVACFDPRYRSEQPVHPDRAFVGSDQVRANWAAVFAGVPDFHWGRLYLEDVEAGQGIDRAVQEMAGGGYQEANTRAWPPEPSS